MYKRYKEISLLLIASSILFSGCIVTSRTIVGSVLGPKGAVMGKATISTEPPTESVFTDSLGRYVIKGVPTGKYTVKAHKLGYTDNEVSINVKEGAMIQADIQLSTQSQKQDMLINLPDENSATSAEPRVEEDYILK